MKLMTKTLARERNVWRCREVDIGFALVKDEGADSYSV